MKKIMVSIVMAFGMAVVAMAGGRYSHDASVLPQSARTELQSNFKVGVSLVKTEKDFGRISEYEVILTDGTEVTYDRDGNWKSVEVRKSSLMPGSYVPAGIKKYMKDNQPGVRVIGIERERGGYEVELSNGVDIKFSKDGGFLRYD